APTAQQVELVLWPDRPPPGNRQAWAPGGEPLAVPMVRSEDGTWTVVGAGDWVDRCYQLQLRHVLPRTGRRSTVRSTDPWSVALSVGSSHSVLVDLDDPAWAPDVWSSTAAPPALRAVDQVIYELHVRDFSRDDPEVPEQLRGTYLG